MSDVSVASPTPVRAPQPRTMRAIPGAPMGNAPRELRERFAEAFTPRPALYWADMLGSAGLAWTLFAISAAVPFGSAALVIPFLLIRARYNAAPLARRDEQALSKPG